MPITQDRMIALVNAGRDYEQALQSLIAQIETAWNRIPLASRPLGLEGDPVSIFAFTAWSIANVNVLLDSPLVSPETLFHELMHFKRHGKENERARRKQAKRRAGGTRAQSAGAERGAEPQQVPRYLPMPVEAAGRSGRAPPADDDDQPPPGWPSALSIDPAQALTQAELESILGQGRPELELEIEAASQSNQPTLPALKIDP